MSAFPFDTHEAVKELSNLATKADVNAMRADLTAFATKIELAETKVEILKWMVGAIGIQTVDVEMSDVAPRIVLSDGRELSAP